MQMNIWKVLVVVSMLAITPANARHFVNRAVNGVCGSADGVSTTSAPTTNLCSAGTATAVSDIGSSSTWSCFGRYGGSTASCSAPLEQSSGSGSGSTSGSGSGSSGGSASGQVPGPSAVLFDSPYYQCTTNYYVAPNGSDSANGSSSSPWATLQHADSMNVGAGACINVAPGTYAGLTVHNGGNAATSTGYVVYRCTTMDACTITGNAGPNGSGAVSFDFSRVSASAPNTVNYVQFDGFVLAGLPAGSQPGYGVGFNVFNGNNSASVASHHVWLLNSIVHGFGLAGIAFCCGEYQYAIHNTSYGNANTQCDAQGSGLAVNISHEIPGYTPTADDMTNPNPLLGPTWQVGGSFFHIVFEYNVTYNNALTQCGSASNPYDTDGNGIIFDTNAGFAGNPTNYTSPMLAAFNISYNNGGGGVHVFRSSNVTVANNTCFNNYIDPYDPGSGRACIDETGGSAATIINNIAVAIPTAVSVCSFSVGGEQWNNSIDGSPASGQAADTFSNNLTDLIGATCQIKTTTSTGEVATWSPDTPSLYLAPPNIETTNPEWVDVGTSSVGTESTPPVGSNFALAPGSKAIGAGLTEPYLPASSVDIGACASALTTCP